MHSERQKQDPSYAEPHNLLPYNADRCLRPLMYDGDIGMGVPLAMLTFCLFVFDPRVLVGYSWPLWFFRVGA
jgi:hypothetical protein